MVGVELMPVIEDEVHWSDEPHFNNFMTWVVITCILFVGISIDYAPHDKPLF